MIYDKTKYHSDGTFPRELPTFQGGVHIGFFLGWAVNHNKISHSFRTEAAEELARFRRGELTAAQLLEITGETLSSDELDRVGNAFARDYYGSGKYFEDYGEIICANLPTAYHVADTPENFAATCAMIDRRFAEQDYSAEPDYQLVLMDALADDLAPHGFKALKSKGWFVRKSETGTDVFSLFFQRGGVLISKPFATVRNKEISEIYHRISGILPKYQKDYHNFSLNFKTELRIGSDHELEVAQSEITSKLDSALRFYESLSTLAKIDIVLNESPHIMCPYTPGGAWDHGAYGIISARLAGRANYTELVGTYRKRLESWNHGRHLKKFDALLSLLANDSWAEL